MPSHPLRHRTTVVLAAALGTCALQAAPAAADATDVRADDVRTDDARHAHLGSRTAATPAAPMSALRTTGVMLWPCWAGLLAGLRRAARGVRPYGAAIQGRADRVGAPPGAWPAVRRASLASIAPCATTV